MIRRPRFYSSLYWCLALTFGFWLLNPQRLDFPRAKDRIGLNIKLCRPNFLVILQPRFKSDSVAWVAQLVKCPTSTQVMISWFVISSPVSGSVLTAQRLEPASDSVCVSLSSPPPLMLCPSLKKINTKKIEEKKRKESLQYSRQQDKT